MRGYLLCMTTTVEDDGTLAAIDAEIAKAELYEFVKMAWPIISPGVDFVDNWHVKLICERLEAVTRGESLRLVINIPPRCMKSTIVSVCWPVWVWLQAPYKQILAISHSREFTRRDALYAKMIMESDWFKTHYSDVFNLAGQGGALRYDNDSNGRRVSLGITGSITGEGADICILDDIMDRKDAFSEAKRSRVIDTYDQSIRTRLNNPKTGAIVAIQQRLVENDHTGHILDSNEEWEHICLPMEYDPHHPYVCEHDPRTVKGELLWPERFDAKVIDGYKGMGVYPYSGQFQQLPAPPEGGMIKRDMFYECEISAGTFTHRHNEEKQQVTEVVDVIFCCVDTAYSISKTADYTVQGAFGGNLASGNLCILDWDRAKIDFRKDQAHESRLDGFKARNGATVVYIEAKSFALQIIKNMKAKGIPVRPLKADVDKMARAHGATPYLETRGIGIPKDAPWLTAFLAEVLSFPMGKHDDQFDVLVYGVQVWFNEYLNGASVQMIQIDGLY